MSQLSKLLSKLLKAVLSDKIYTKHNFGHMNSYFFKFSLTKCKNTNTTIMNVLPELINEYEEQQLVSTALNEQVKEAYNRVKSERPKPNLSLQIEDRYLHLKHIAIEKGVDNSCVETYTLEPSMDNLKILLEKMELSYYMQTLQDRAGCNIIALSLNTDVPFSVLGMGSNSETALQDALITCFENLRILLLDIE